MKIKLGGILTLEPVYPVGPEVAVYKVDKPGLALAFLQAADLDAHFKEDLAAFNAVGKEALPSFLAQYHNTFAPEEPAMHLIAIVHFRLRDDKSSPGWALFIIFDQKDLNLARDFASAVFDRTAAELRSEPHTAVHLSKNYGQGNT